MSVSIEDKADNVVYASIFLAKMAALERRNSPPEVWRIDDLPGVAFEKYIRPIISLPKANTKDLPYLVIRALQESLAKNDMTNTLTALSKHWGTSLVDFIQYQSLPWMEYAAQVADIDLVPGERFTILPLRRLHIRVVLWVGSVRRCEA